MAVQDFDIILQIENEFLKCSKGLLTENSRVFEVLCAGRFSVNLNDPLILHDVKYVAMKQIVEILATNSYNIINECTVFLILETASMYAFLTIEKQCLETLETMKINSSNCYRFFIGLEKTQEVFNLLDTYLKAIYTTFMNFHTIGLSKKRLADFHLRHICYYLGNTNLQWENEKDILISVSLWHNLHNVEINDTLRLLSCVDFQRIDCSSIEVVQNKFKIFKENKTLSQIIKCIIAIKNNASLEDFDDQFVINSSKLLLQTKRRFGPEMPCFVFYNNHSSNLVTIGYYDVNKFEWKKLLDFNLRKIDKLKGYRIFNYQNYLYLFGGKYKKWNRRNKTWEFNEKLLAYNFLYESVEEREITHLAIDQIESNKLKGFEYEIVKNILYIIKTNCPKNQTKFMYWINLNDKETKVYIEFLPHSSVKTKHCNFGDRLFMLDRSMRIAWIFNHSKLKWINLRIVDPKRFISNDSSKLSLFSYNNRLCIKGSNLVELEWHREEYELRTVKKTDLNNVHPYDEIRSVVCKNTVFTFYKLNFYDEVRKVVRKSQMSFDRFNMDTLESGYIFLNESMNEMFVIDGKGYKLRRDFQLQLFKVSHYKNVQDYHEYVNTNFFEPGE